MEQYKQARKIVKQVLVKQFGPQAGYRYYNDKLVGYRRMKWYGGFGDKISMKVRKKVLGKIRKKLHDNGISFLECHHKRIRYGHCDKLRYSAFILKMPYKYEGKLAEKKLKDTGFEALLQDQDLLQLVQLD